MSEIASAAVLGAGVMGAAIAAHLANAGLSVLLLDLVPKEGRRRNALAEAALERLETKFSSIGVVIALRHFDEVRTNQPGQINGHGHFE